MERQKHLKKLVLKKLKAMDDRKKRDEAIIHLTVSRLRLPSSQKSAG